MEGWDIHGSEARGHEPTGRIENVIVTKLRRNSILDTTRRIGHTIITKLGRNGVLDTLKLHDRLRRSLGRVFWLGEQHLDDRFMVNIGRMCTYILGHRSVLVGQCYLFGIHGAHLSWCNHWMLVKA